MAYKKYIQRNGKLYGPYLYESKRVDGKVVSEYHGSEEHKKSKGVKVRDYKKILFIFIGVFLVGFLIYFLVNMPSQNKMSGNVILGVDSSYKKGEPLDGVLKFSLNEGELIPASSKIVFENSGKTYEFPLNQVFDEPALDGEYYMKEKDIQGSGEGYGMEGERAIYPEVNFVLQVYKEATEEENDSTEEEIVQEGSIDEATVNETNEESNPAPITGETVKSSGGFLTSLFGMTGMVSMELQEEIEGKVSKDKPFIYDLKEGERVELKPKSVSIKGEESDDKIISLNIEDNKMIVTTDYSEIEKGYGENYLGDKEKTFSLDLSDLNLILEEGDLNVKLVYEGQEILSLPTTLKESEKTSEEIVEEPEEVEEVVEVPSEIEIQEEVNKENETVQEIINSSIWDISDFLTSEERKLLLDEFGNIQLKTTKSELFKDRVIRGYELGEYSIEYSYDSSLDKEVLEVQMERDRIKFLKDIANSISKEESSSENIQEFNESYISNIFYHSESF